MLILTVIFFIAGVAAAWNGAYFWPHMLICSLLCLLIDSIYEVKFRIEQLFAFYSNQ